MKVFPKEPGVLYSIDVTKYELRFIYLICLRETHRFMEGRGRRNGPTRANKIRAKNLFKGRN